MAQNKRNVLINTRVRFFFTVYVLFSVLAIALFLGWDLFLNLLLNYFPGAESCLSSFHGFPMVIKMTLLLVWGMSSFLLAYTYLEAKFIGLFERMDELFTAMLQNPQLKLEFRKGDPFNAMADSFNRMKQMFLERIEKRKALIGQLSTEIESLQENASGLSEKQLQELVQKIDLELGR